MNWPIIQGVTPPSLSDNSAAGYFWDDTPKPAVQQQEADEDPGTLAKNHQHSRIAPPPKDADWSSASLTSRQQVW